MHSGRAKERVTLTFVTEFTVVEYCHFPVNEKFFKNIWNPQHE